MDRESVLTDERRRSGTGRARERLRAEREREQRSVRRLRTLKMAGAVVLVLGVAALIAVGVSAAGGEEDASARARPVGTGSAAAPVTMTVYEDFRCPGCKAFEDGFRETVNELREAGDLRVEYHLVTLIDGNLAGEGSRRAAEAALCAADAGKFVEYHDLLYRNQPPEQKDAFADRGYLLRLAGRVDGLSTDAFETCVRDGVKGERVERSQQAFLETGYNQTPTVLVDGERAFDDPADPLTPDKLRQLVARKAA
ncbi:DsbA family protein [Streptomyces sp. TR06-5]|uniref:DsbA family protein n=1 Tax=unclassified Streptomyces TaxID=2593676 RepID=UPI0039A22657